MERTPVQSSNLESVGYDHVSLTLEIAFLNGSAYQYFDVPEHIFDGLMGASSKGSYFNQNIKKAGYSDTRIS